MSHAKFHDNRIIAKGDINIRKSDRNSHSMNHQQTIHAVLQLILIVLSGATQLYKVQKSTKWKH